MRYDVGEFQETQAVTTGVQAKEPDTRPEIINRINAWNLAQIWHYAI